MTCFRRFWVKEFSHSETISNEKCSTSIAACVLPWLFTQGTWRLPGCYFAVKDMTPLKGRGDVKTHNSFARTVYPGTRKCVLRLDRNSPVKSLFAKDKTCSVTAPHSDSGIGPEDINRTHVVRSLKPAKVFSGARAHSSGRNTDITCTFRRVLC